MRKPKVACDFDGVVHAYSSPWTTVLEINDGPMPGAIAWLREALKAGWDVIIHSCRITPNRRDQSQAAAAIRAIKVWLQLHGLEIDFILKLQFWTKRGKPHALFYMDDRGFRFEGVFPDARRMEALSQRWTPAAVELCGACEDPIGTWDDCPTCVAWRSRRST